MAEQIKSDGVAEGMANDLIYKKYKDDNKNSSYNSNSSSNPNLVPGVLQVVKRNNKLVPYDADKIMLATFELDGKYTAFGRLVPMTGSSGMIGKLVDGAVYLMV